jgi:hypothetical protein
LWFELWSTTTYWAEVIITVSDRHIVVRDNETAGSPRSRFTKTNKSCFSSGSSAIWKIPNILMLQGKASSGANALPRPREHDARQFLPLFEPFFPFLSALSN